MLDETIPPSSSHFRISETRQVLFLTGKCQPSGDIVPSNILDHDC